MNKNLHLNIETNLPAEELAKQVKQLEPWSHKVVFSNGVDTENYEKRKPFNAFPLRKLYKVADHIPFENFRGGNLLDIGCNIGFNTIHSTQCYDLNSTGIDVVKRNIEKSIFLSELAKVNCEFIQTSAETFTRKEFFDIILHFGTLYHLPNPILSLSLAYDNLQHGGWMAIETQTFDDPDLDPNLCYFIHGFNNDNTNFWALSTNVLIKTLEFLKFLEIKEISRVHHNSVHNQMYRIILVCRK